MLRMMFLGAPGVGKGTYASKLAPLFKIPTISTGDLVRAEITKKTTLGTQMETFSTTGELVPDTMILDLIYTRLQNEDAKKGYLLDGFPRTLPQAKALDQVAPLNLVVNIELAEWVLYDKLMGRRMCASCGMGYNIAHIQNGEYHMPPLLPAVPGVCDHCGGTELIKRADDSKDIIQHRLKVYDEETKPLIEYYQEKDVLKSFHVKKGLDDLPTLIELVNSSIK